MSVTTSYEGARGCGYRQPGGLYLVSDGRGEHCPLLPYELTVCPVCGGGIKPARGWTWIQPDQIIEPRDHGTADHSARCPLTTGIDRAGLIWIGDAYYSPETFIAEAERMGISRRIPAVPRDFELGETWALLAHRKALTKSCPECGGHASGLPRCETCDATGYVPAAAIFYLFQPSRIEYVVREDDDDEKIEKLEARGITPVRVIPVEEQGVLPV